MSGYTHHGDCSTSDPCKRCFQFGQTTEQKRIIKLLEPYANNKCDELCAGGCDCFGKYEAEHFIALIKGEQKSQSEHLTDAIQTTVWAYTEGEQK